MQIIASYLRLAKQLALLECKPSVIINYSPTLLSVELLGSIHGIVLLVESVETVNLLPLTLAGCMI